MKLSRSKCRIVGVQTGELSYNSFGTNPVLRVKFAIVTEGGDTAGYFERASSWSDKSKELLAQLAESLETDALPYLFDEPIVEAQPGEEPTDEPPQI